MESVCGRCRRWWIASISFVLLVCLLIFPVEAVEDTRDEFHWRQLAVDAATSGLTFTEDAARAALRDRGAGLSEFYASGFEDAVGSDYRRMLAALTSIAGKRTRERADELLESGTNEEIERFFTDQWRALQIEDFREEAQQLIAEDETSVVAEWASEALADGDDALFEFSTEGIFEAEFLDLKRELYELAASDLPAVAQGAADALSTDNEEIMRDYVSFGQFLVAESDHEIIDLQRLAAEIDRQTKEALHQLEVARQQGLRAEAAAAAARAATEKAFEHMQAAGEAYGRAERGAREAGILATQAAQAASEAAGAASQAHEAMLRTAGAMNRAASGAALASQYSAQASQMAGAANASRGDAQTAYESVRLAQEAQAAYANFYQRYAAADQAAVIAGQASAAAANAAASADAAAVAADNAAGQAGVTNQAAEEARAGAAQARAAAISARTAADRATNLTAAVQAKVNEVAQATQEAIAHAEEVTRYANEAAQHAAEAREAANLAGEAAEKSRLAADHASALQLLGEQISELARTAREERLAAETQERVREADERYIDQESTPQAPSADEQPWREIIARIEEQIPAAHEGNQEALTAINNDAVTLLEIAPNFIKNATVIALSDGSDRALLSFALALLPKAVIEYEQSLVNYWAAHGEGEIATQAMSAAMASENRIHTFLYEELPQLQLPLVQTSIQQIIDGYSASNQHLTQANQDPYFDVVIADAQDAIASGDLNTMKAFLATGLKEALATDGKILAYNSLDNIGPYSTMVAEVAIHDTDDNLIDYLFEQRNAALSLDALLVSNDAKATGILQHNQEQVARAQQAAAEAESIYQSALSHAEQAEEYAQQAREFEQQAREYADGARQQLTIAQEHYTRAVAARDRALQAAYEAQHSADVATEYENQAVNYAVAANQSAADAYAAAQEARQAANEANEFAEGANSIVEEMYAYAMQTENNVNADYTADVLDGYEEDIDRRVREQIFEIITPIIKDLTGITDIEDCLQKDVMGCFNVLLSFTPAGVWKHGYKFARAVFKLIDKVPTIRRIIDDAKALKHLKVTGSCAINGTRVRRSANEPCEWVEVGTRGKVILIETRKMPTKEAVLVRKVWDPTTPMSNPMKFPKEGQIGDRIKMSEEELRSFRSFASDITDQVVIDGRVQINSRYAERLRNTRKLERGPKELNAFGTTPDYSTNREFPFPSARGNYRKVGAKRNQNLDVASDTEMYVRPGVNLRIDQAGLSKRPGSLVDYAGGPRPDLYIQGEKMEFQDGLIIEYDDYSSNRYLEHARNALAYNPNATVVLVRVDEKHLDSLDSDLWGFVAQNTKSIRDRNVKAYEDWLKGQQ